MAEVLTIRCRDACGASVTDPVDVEMAASNAGWSLLPTAGGWRCCACWRALNEAAQLPGAPAAPDFTDPLPPHSIGALRKPTAQTIVAPAVKGNA